ncbi:hypothetical protein J7S33_09535, partial [Saccharothrix algeriensis]
GGAWVKLVTRGAAQASAVVVVDGREVSRHRLDAADELHWEYSVRLGDEEVREWCDGRELVRVANGRTTRSPVPGPDASPDEPWCFSAWTGVVDGWLVELLRPVDLLSRVVVADVVADGGAVRVAARPRGNEPSPYSGLAVPDGRSLDLLLDVGSGCFTEAVVTAAGSVRRYRVTLA